LVDYYENVKYEVVPIHAIKRIGSLEVYLHSFLTSALDGREWLASRHCHSNPRSNRWLGPGVSVDVLDRDKSLAPGGIRTLDHPFCSLVSLSIELFRPLKGSGRCV
jgi:hypothetical protein